MRHTAHQLARLLRLPAPFFLVVKSISLPQQSTAHSLLSTTADRPLLTAPRALLHCCMLCAGAAAASQAARS
jgi:hypothetical protein